MAEDRDDLFSIKYSLALFKLCMSCTCLKINIYKKLWNKHTTIDMVSAVNPQRKNKEMKCISMNDENQSINKSWAYCILNHTCLPNIFLGLLIFSLKRSVEMLIYTITHSLHIYPFIIISVFTHMYNKYRASF